MSVESIDVAVHPIAAFDNIFDTFSTIAMFKAPLTGVPDRQIKVRGLVRTNLKQLSDTNKGEMERFLDGITDLFSIRMTVERMEEISKKVGDLDHLGKTLEKIQKNYSSLSSPERMYYISIASEVMIGDLEGLEAKISLEAIRSDDIDKFRYLLVSQTIIRTILDHMRRTVGESNSLSDDIKERKVNDIISWALFSIVRIEAFRRGKIGLEGLRDTLSSIIAHSTIQYHFPSIALPDEAISEE